MRMSGIVPNRVARGSVVGSWLLCAAVLSAAGCVSDDPPLRAEPRRTPPAPQGAIVTVVDLNAGRYADDSNQNGCADLISATVYLWNPNQHPSPLDAPGSFRFELRMPTADAADDRPFAAWTFDAAQAEGFKSRTIVGTGYFYRMSLIDVGASDGIPLTDMLLTCTYTQVGQTPIITRPVRVGVGRLR